jgi:hypothetical protein
LPYTYTKPTVFPDLATDDVYNGLLGAINVQEPPTDIKTDGWDYGQKPPREFFNWYGRVYNNWIKYIDERITAILSSKTSEDADNLFRSQW